MIAEKSAAIYLRHNAETGRIVVKRGELCDIYCRDHSNPIEALLHLLAWEDGEFSIEFKSDLNKPTLDSKDRSRISLILQAVSQLHETAGEPFSLATKYVAHSINLGGSLSPAERSVLLLFLEPTSLRRALVLSNLDAEQTLQCIHSLISKGLLLKTEEHFPAEEERAVFLSQPKRNESARSSGTAVFLPFFGKERL